jgi:short-subunit dehydrogenase
MRIELAPRKIHVASVHPIGTWTEFSDAAARRSGKGAGEREGHTPGMFMQPPERVARAVIKCLKRPKPEVWTSFSARMFAGVLTMSPRFADFVMRVADKTGQR